MQDQNPIFEYWNCCLQQEALHKLDYSSIKNFLHKVSRSECSNGKIDNQVIVEQLLARGGAVVVIPNYAKYQDQYFLPSILVVDLDAAGNFITKKNFALPIIPYTVLEPTSKHSIAIGVAEDFDNYVVMHPPIWSDDQTLLTWQQQLAYSQQLLDEVNNTWCEDLLQIQCVLQDDALVFSLADLCSPVNMSLSILNIRKNISLIEAPRGSGKSTYIKNKLIKAWAAAAMKGEAAPRYVWLEYGKNIKYVSIFDCIDDPNRVPIFLEPHESVVKAHEDYIQAQQVVTNLRQVVNSMKGKYPDKNGIYSRIHQLQSNLKDAKAQKRHLDVLNSIWLRQVELVSTWGHMFDFVPTLQTRRLKRLYLFFKQNFPNVTVKGLNQRQLTELFHDKIRRVDNSLRIVADTLHQVEHDLYQETLVRDKCMQWFMTQDLQVESLEEAEDLVANHLWLQVQHATAHYWRQYFDIKPESKAYLDDNPDSIDVLVVENSEYVSPMQAAQLFAISKRAIVMGNYNPICRPRFSVQIDYELTQYFGLASCDSDFEDLQFDGKLGSVGNMWNLVAQGNDADEQFNVYPSSTLQYSYIDSHVSSTSNMGSKVNTSIIALVVEWLRANVSIMPDIVVYTCFRAQATLLRQALDSNSLSHIPIRLVQDPNFEKSATSVFVPVYSLQDPGPYVFDLGDEILNNLIANTTENLIVIGDMRIFKSELHSASGKFAKHFTIKKEVVCV